MKKKLFSVLALLLVLCFSTQTVSANDIIWQDRLDDHINASLNTWDKTKNGRYYDGYSFNRTFYEGDLVELDLESEDFDAYLNVYFCFEDGERLVASNDDYRKGTNAHVLYRAPAEGYLYVEVTSSSKNETGNYWFYWNVIPA